MRIQKTGYQSYSQKNNFGAIHVVGDEKTMATIVNIVKPNVNKNYKFTYSNPFLYGPERGFRQYYVNGTNEIEAEIIKALKDQGRVPRNVLKGNNKVLSQDAFDKFIQETHIMDI